MTYPVALAAFPALAESVLGPVLIGLTGTSREPELIDEVWRTAAASVPTTMPVIKVQAGKGAQPQKHQRRVLTGQGPDYPVVARLCDARNQEPADETWKRWQWEAGARMAPDDGTRQLVGPGRTAIRVDVTCYRLRAGEVLCAQQLALFRHYVVVGFHALDPGLVVLGGQHGWQDSWWPVTGKAGQ